MSIIMKTDDQTIEGIDFEAEVPCSANECDRLVTWIVTYSFCPCQELLCEDHARIYMDATKSLLQSKSGVVGCREHGVGARRMVRGDIRFHRV